VFVSILIIQASYMNNIVDVVLNNAIGTAAAGTYAFRLSRYKNLLWHVCNPVLIARFCLVTHELLQGISCVFPLAMDRPVQLRLLQCQSSLGGVAV